MKIGCYAELPVALLDRAVNTDGIRGEKGRVQWREVGDNDNGGAAVGRGVANVGGMVIDWGGCRGCLSLVTGCLRRRQAAGGMSLA